MVSVDNERLAVRPAGISRYSALNYRSSGSVSRRGLLFDGFALRQSTRPQCGPFDLHRCTSNSPHQFLDKMSEKMVPTNGRSRGVLSRNSAKVYRRFCRLQELYGYIRSSVLR